MQKKDKKEDKKERDWAQDMLKKAAAKGRQETKDFIRDGWRNRILKEMNCSDEEATKIFDYGVKFLDVIARAAIDELLRGEEKQDWFSGFEKCMLGSVSQLLNAFYDEMLYRAWWKSYEDEEMID